MQTINDLFASIPPEAIQLMLVAAVLTALASLVIRGLRLILLLIALGLLSTSGGLALLGDFSLDALNFIPNLF